MKILEVRTLFVAYSGDWKRPCQIFGGKACDSRWLVSQGTRLHAGQSEMDPCQWTKCTAIPSIFLLHPAIPPSRIKPGYCSVYLGLGGVIPEEILAISRGPSVHSTRLPKLKHEGHMNGWPYRGTSHTYPLLGLVGDWRSV